MYNDNPFWKFRRKLLENEEKHYCIECGRDMGPNYYCEKCDYPSEKDKPKSTMSTKKKKKLGLLKNKIEEAKRIRPSDSEKYGPPEEYRTREGETKRSDLLSAREDEVRKARRDALKTVSSAMEEPNHGLPANITDIIKNASSRKLFKHSNKLVKSKNPKLRTLASHLSKIAGRIGRSPIHPKPKRPDYEPSSDDRLRKERSSGD